MDHHYPIVIMVKSSNHMFAYSFFFSLYQLLDIFHRRLLLLLQRWMAVVRSTLCLDVHQPQSFINDERRRKRISFFLSRLRKERERKDGGGRTLLFSSRPFLCCAQQFANLSSNSGRKPHINGHFLFSILFRLRPSPASLQVLTL
jgi:hypothetical protein